MSAHPGNYWETRKHLAYYQRAVTWAKKHTPIGGSILDVGGGVAMGCKYLDWLPGYERTSVEVRPGRREGGNLSDEIVQELMDKEDARFVSALGDTRVIFSRFETWEPDKHYDTVMCLQCIEHVRDPWAFAQKLKTVADRLILSVPFKWPEGLEDGHLHDPIDRIKVKTWVGKEPTTDLVIGNKPWERLIGLYL